MDPSSPGHVCSHLSSHSSLYLFNLSANSRLTGTRPHRERCFPNLLLRRPLLEIQSSPTTPREIHPGTPALLAPLGGCGSGWEQKDEQRPGADLDLTREDRRLHNCSGPHAAPSGLRAVGGKSKVLRCVTLVRANRRGAAAAGGGWPAWRRSSGASCGVLRVNTRLLCSQASAAAQLRVSAAPPSVSGLHHHVVPVVWTPQMLLVGLFFTHSGNLFVSSKPHKRAEFRLAAPKLQVESCSELRLRLRVCRLGVRIPAILLLVEVCSHPSRAMLESVCRTGNCEPVLDSKSVTTNYDA